MCNHKTAGIQKERIIQLTAIVYNISHFNYFIVSKTYSPVIDCCTFCAIFEEKLNFFDEISHSSYHKLNS